MECARLVAALGSRVGPKPEPRRGVLGEKGRLDYGRTSRGFKAATRRALHTAPGRGHNERQFVNSRTLSA